MACIKTKADLKRYIHSRKQGTVKQNKARGKDTERFDRSDITPSMIVNFFTKKNNDKQKRKKLFEDMYDVIKRGQYDSRSIVPSFWRKIKGLKDLKQDDMTIFHDKDGDDANMTSLDAIQAGISFHHVMGSIKTEMDLMNKYNLSAEEREQIIPPGELVPGISGVGAFSAIGREVAMSQGIVLAPKKTMKNQQKAQFDVELAYAEVGLKAMKVLEERGFVTIETKEDNDSNPKVVNHRYKTMKGEDYSRSKTIDAIVIRINMKKLLKGKTFDRLTEREKSIIPKYIMGTAGFGERSEVEGSFKELAANIKGATFMKRLLIPSNTIAPFTSNVKNAHYNHDVNASDTTKKVLDRKEAGEIRIPKDLEEVFDYIFQMMEDNEMSFEEVAKTLNVNEYKDLMGFAEEFDSTAATRASDRGVSLSRTTPISEFFDNYGSVKHMPLHLREEIKRNGRGHYMTTFLNPQTDKFFSRYVMQIPEYTIPAVENGKMTDTFNHLLAGIADQAGVSASDIMNSGQNAELDEVLSVYEAHMNKGAESTLVMISRGFKQQDGGLSGSVWQKYDSIKAIYQVRKMVNEGKNGSAEFSGTFMPKPDGTASGAIIIAMQMAGKNDKNASLYDALGLDSGVKGTIDDAYGVAMNAFSNFYKSSKHENTKTDMEKAFDFMLASGPVRGPIFKGLRDLAKESSMPVMYSQGKESSIKTVAKNLTDKVYKDLVKYPDEYENVDTILNWVKVADKRTYRMLKYAKEQQNGLNNSNYGTLMTNDRFSQSVYSAIQKYMEENVTNQMYELINDKFVNNYMSEYNNVTTATFSEMKDIYDENRQRITLIPPEMLFDQVRRNMGGVFDIKKFNPATITTQMVQDLKKNNKGAVVARGVPLMKLFETVNNPAKNSTVSKWEFPHEINVRVNMIHSIDFAILNEAFRRTFAEADSGTKNKALSDLDLVANGTISVHDAISAHPTFSAAYQDHYREAARDINAVYDIHSILALEMESMRGYEPLNDTRKNARRDALVNAKKKAKKLADMDFSGKKIFGFEEVSDAEVNLGKEIIPASQRSKGKKTQQQNQQSHSSNQQVAYKIDEATAKEAHDDIMALKNSGDNVVLFDTETIGDESVGKGAHSLPWQIHAVKIVNGKRAEQTFYFEVDGESIDPGVVAFNNFKSERTFSNMIQRKFNAQGFKDNTEAYKAFSDFVGKDDMIAFRADFDAGVIKKANNKWGSKVKSITHDMAAAIAYEERIIKGYKGGTDAQWEVHNRMVLNNDKNHKDYISGKDDKRLHDATFDTKLLTGIYDVLGTNTKTVPNPSPFAVGGTSEVKLSDKNTLLIPIDVSSVRGYLDRLRGKDNGFVFKPEFHSTVLGFSFNKIMKNHPDKRDEVQALIDKSDFTFETQAEMYKISKDYKGNPQWNTKDHTRESIVVKLDMPGAKVFVDDLNKLLGENIPAPFPHVTIATKGHKDGIGITSEADFESMNPELVDKMKDKKNKKQRTDDSYLREDGKFFEPTPITKTALNAPRHDIEAFEKEPMGERMVESDWKKIMERVTKVVDVIREEKDAPEDLVELYSQIMSPEYQKLMQSMLDSAQDKDPMIKAFFKQNTVKVAANSLIPAYISNVDQMMLPPLPGMVDENGVVTETGLLVIRHEIAHAKSLAFIQEFDKDPAVQILRHAVENIDLYRDALENAATSQMVRDRFKYFMNQDSKEDMMSEMVAVLGAEPKVRVEFLKAMRDKNADMGMVYKFVNSVKKLFRMIAKFDFTDNKINQELLIASISDVLVRGDLLNRNKPAEMAKIRDKQSKAAVDNYFKKHGRNRPNPFVKEAFGATGSKKTGKSALNDALNYNKKANTDYVVSDPLSTFMRESNSYVADLLWDKMGPQSIPLAKKGAVAVDKYLSESSETYLAFRSRALNIWDSPEMAATKTYLNPASLKQRDWFQKVSSQFLKASQTHGKLTSTEIRRLENRMEGMSKDKKAKLNDIFSLAPTFMLVKHDGLLREIAQSNTTVDREIKRLERASIAIDIKDAKDFANLYVDGIPTGNKYSGKLVAKTIERNKNTEQLTALYSLKKIDGSQAMIRDIYSNNNDLYQDLVDKVLSLEELTEKTYNANNDEKNFRGNMTGDYFDDNMEFKVASNKEILDKTFDIDNGWVTAISAKDNGGYALMYRKGVMSQNQEGFGTNVGYNNTDVFMPKDFKPNSKNMKHVVEFGVGKKKYYKMVVPTSIKKEAGLIQNPAQTIVRSYAHMQKIEDTQAIREEIVSQSGIRYTIKSNKPHHIKEIEQMATERGDNEPMFIKLGSGTTYDALPDAVKQRFSIIKPKMSNVGGFNHEVHLVRNDVAPWMVGYERAMPFKNVPILEPIFSTVLQAISLMKIHMIIINPAKVAMDTISTTTLLASLGVSPVTIAKGWKQNIPLMSSMSKLRAEQVRLSLKANSGNKAAAKQLKKVEADLRDHPLMGAINAGVMQSLSTDIITRDYDTITGLQNNIDKVIGALTRNKNGNLNAFGDGVMALADKGLNIEDLFMKMAEMGENYETLEPMADEIAEMGKRIKRIKKDKDVEKYISEFFGSPSSTLTRLGSIATTYPDAMSRIIYRDHLISKTGKTESQLTDKEISKINVEVSDMMPDYAIHPPMMLDATGRWFITPFVSWSARIQRTILMLAKNNPVSFLAPTLILEAMGIDAMDTPYHIVGSNYITRDEFINNVFDDLFSLQTILPTEAFNFDVIK